MKDWSTCRTGLEQLLRNIPAPTVIPARVAARSVADYAGGQKNRTGMVSGTIQGKTKKQTLEACHGSESGQGVQRAFFSQRINF